MTPSTPGTAAGANASPAERVPSRNQQRMKELEQELAIKKWLCQEVERQEAERQRVEKYRLELERKKRETDAIEAVIRKEREDPVELEKRLVKEQRVRRMAQ